MHISGLSGCGQVLTMNADYKRRAGQLLREERTHAGITRAEMAQCLGWPESYLRVIENGYHAFGMHVIRRYANALCVDLNSRSQ